jgi:hypothetical protein
MRNLYVWLKGFVCMHKIDINLSPSKQFIFLIILALMGSLFTVFTLPVGGLIKGILITTILSYGFYILYFYGFLRHSNSIVRIFGSHDSEWNIMDRSGTNVAELCGSSTVTTCCAILRFKVSDRKMKRSCVVFPDSVPEGFYRKLLVSIKST